MAADARTKRARASENLGRCKGTEMQRTYILTDGRVGRFGTGWEMDGWMYVRVDLFIYVHACVRWVGMYVCM